MKREDLFLTDNRLEVIRDFHVDDEYNISDFEDEELMGIRKKVEWLNGLC